MSDYRLLYLGVWLLIIALYVALGPTPYPPLSFTILAAVLGLPLLSYGMASVVPQPRIRQIYVSEATYGWRLAYLFMGWAALSVVSLAAGGPLPILDIGSNSYAEFGISGIGGLQNSLALAIVPLFYMQFRSTRRWRYLLGVIVLFVWQIITFRRGMLVSFVLQLAVVSQLAYGFRHKFRMALIGLAVVVLFGVIGDLRGVPNPFLGLFDGWRRDLLSSLPSGFTWAYIYATSGLSNLVNNYDQLLQCGEYFYPFNAVLPNLVKGSSTCSYELYDVSLNVGSVYSGILVSGIIPTIIYFTALAYLYERVRLKVAKFRSEAAISAYTVILIGVAFSPFSDMIFLPTYMFGILLLSYFPAPARPHPSEPSQS